MSTRDVSLDDIVDELNDIVAGLQDNEVTQRDAWNREIQTAMSCLGQAQGFATCASDVDLDRLESARHKQSEKYGAAWLNFQNGENRKQLHDVVLALECTDADKPDITMGLHTLLDRTATFKVLFFWCQDKDEMRRIFEILEDDIGAFQRCRPSPTMQYAASLTRQ